MGIKLLKEHFTQDEFLTFKKTRDLFNGDFTGYKVNDKIYGQFDDWKGKRNGAAKDTTTSSLCPHTTVKSDVQKTSRVPTTVPRSREYSSWKQYHEKRHPGVS